MAFEKYKPRGLFSGFYGIRLAQEQKQTLNVTGDLRNDKAIQLQAQILRNGDFVYTH